MLQRLDDMARRYTALTEEMSQPDVLTDARRMRALGREQAELQEPVAAYHELQAVEAQLAEARALLADGADEELRALAQEEAETLGRRRADLLAQLADLLRPRDPNDTRDVIVEIRAGTGGEEASLFAADLFRMYVRYAEARRWKVEVLNTSETDLGGFKEVVFEVAGRGAYSRLKYESGVHRVQRVPATEASGRIHTSTATVAVLPEVDEVEIDVNEADLRIDVYRSSGHGGQSVNTTDSAVRITHLPTGLVVTCQDEKSQLKNKVRAMSVLRARLYDLEQQRAHAEQAEARRAQVGTGERAEKIRTYNFPQNRVTDHRIGLTLHNLDRLMAGDLDPLIEPLILANGGTTE
ncbi:MAG TPA: peptide chain release factor 1 [Chloroflexota bacterium]|nr:peptide chain release factor 1 [Chloroflexota bacterium]